MKSERRIETFWEEELGRLWPSLSEEGRMLFLSALAALPGGEELEGLVEPLPLGWLEAELLGKMLLALKDADAVRKLVSLLLAEEEGSRE